MKQTAVEWLESKLKNVEYNPLEKNGYSNALERLYNQAKEMEKKQLIEMHDKGFDSVVQLNDDYAIEFAEWCLKIRFEPIENISVKKLLEIYKKDNL
jgi:hypothetical protein